MTIDRLITILGAVCLLVSAFNGILGREWMATYALLSAIACAVWAVYYKMPRGV